MYSSVHHAPHLVPPRPLALPVRRVRDGTVGVTVESEKTDEELLKLFDRYPGGGRELVEEAIANDLAESQNYKARWRKGGNSRHTYARYLQEKTGQASCAYCRVKLTDTCDHWLMTGIDHVVPCNSIKHEKIEEAWIDDLANAVLCCSACNGFLNQVTLRRIEVPIDKLHPKTAGEFLDLRNRVFLLKRKKALERHKGERKFFDDEVLRDDD